MHEDDLECLVCRSNAGVQRISPGPIIHEGEHWLVEHAYPSSVRGWLVIVLRRHAEALHQLSSEEATELGLLQRKVAQVLHAQLAPLKEYAMCFGEGDGFSHLHVHLVPRTADLDPELRGPRIMAGLQPGKAVLPEETIATFCEELKLSFENAAEHRGRPCAS